VYIKDLSPEVTDQELSDLFSQYGTITSAVVMRKEDGTSKGFGFVNFSSHDAAVKSVETLHQKPFGTEEKPLWCGRAQKKSERESELKNRFKLIKMERIKQYTGINLYIKNLEDSIREEQLKNDFSMFGTIKSLKIMTDDKKNSKGFGFICFEHPEEAQRAIAEMNNRPLPGTSKPLYVAFHEPKEIRRQKLAQEQLQRKQNPRANLIQAVYPPPGYSYPPNAGPPQYMYPTQLVRQPPPRNWPYPPPPATGSGPYQSNQPPSRPPQQQRQNVPRTKAPPPVRHPNEPVSLEQLTMYPPDQQKILIGEKLYVQIFKKQPEKAGKITGMLLDSGWSLEELLSLLESEDKLNAKIEEALVVLFNPT